MRTENSSAESLQQILSDILTFNEFAAQPEGREALGGEITLALYLVPHFDKDCPIRGLDTDEKISEYILNHPDQATYHAKIIVSIADESYRYKDKKIYNIDKSDV